MSLLFAGTLSAAVEKTIAIDSQPSNAEVFLMQGRKETSIGKTPLQYEARFHSEKSVLRIKLKKNGYDDTVGKLSATDSNVSISLDSFQFTVSPAQHGNEVLRNAQKQINPVIESELPRLIRTTGRFQYQLDGPVGVILLGDRPYASVSVNLQEVEGNLASGDKERLMELIRELWGQFGPGLAMPLAGRLQGKGIAGLILELTFDDQKTSFAVGSHTETQTEMVCAGGYQQVSTYDNCRYQGSNGCVGGTVIQSVYNPCIHRVPRIRSSVVLDPESQTTEGKARASFMVTSSQFSMGDMPLGQVSYNLIDSKGNMLTSLDDDTK